MEKIKQLITLSISLLLFFLKTNFAYGKINEYQIFPSSIGSDRFYFLPVDLRPSDKPYLFWECRSSQINNLHLYYEINKSSSNGRTVALGNKSELGGCSGETPFRYDFTFSFNKNFINQLILDKGCDYIKIGFEA